MEKITIMQTSDLHGFLYPTNYFESKNIGILSIPEYLSKSDLIIDTGDLIQGSALTTFQNKNNLSKDNAVIDAINKIGYDFLTFGNHEFNFGKEYLITSLKSFNGEILVANIKGLEGLEIRPYKIVEIKGLKIAIIGLMTQAVPFFEKPENIAGLEFLDAVECYAKYEQELKENSDIIIVNYHGGFEYDFRNPNPKSIETTKENQGIEMLERFDSIDILLSGHQHLVLCDKFRGTLIMQPGYAGEYISKVEIDPITREITGELINNPGIIEERFKDCYTQLENSVQEFLNQPIYKLDEDIKIVDHFKARMRGDPYINLIQMIQLDAAKADISVTSLFDTAQGFKKEITMRQVIANYPFSNSLKTLRLHRDDIIAALEVCASYFEIEDGELIASDKFTNPKKQHYQYDLFFGFIYHLDITKPVGSRVVYTSLEDKYYNVAMSNYRASNYGWYPMYENKEVVNEIPTDMQELVINYLNEGKLDKSRLAEENIKIIY